MIKCLYVFILILLVAPFLFYLPLKVRGCYITKILDGDTLKVQFYQGDYQEISLRLNHIDALEKAQGELAFKAIRRIEQLTKLKNHKYQCHFKGKDIYGRFLGDIYLELNPPLLGQSVTLSEILIKEGLVFIYPYTHFDTFYQKQHFLRLNFLARQKKIGIFSHHKILTPWAFRKKLKKKPRLKTF